MKKYLLLFLLLILMFSYSCEKSDSDVYFNPYVTQYFSGTFQTSGTDQLSGTVDLYISNGYYECYTNLPYGRGSGKLETEGVTIAFIDTSFFIIPALYGPSYVLSGMHEYRYDGENLKIWKNLNETNVVYELTQIIEN